MSVQVAFCLFHRFFHRIPAAEDDLDVLVGVHLDAFHHLTDDAVIVALCPTSFCSVSRMISSSEHGNDTVSIWFPPVKRVALICVIYIPPIVMPCVCGISLNSSELRTK